MSGLLIGISLARTISGYVGYLFGWRLMFVLAAIIMSMLLTILYFRFPSAKSNLNLTYRELLKSILKIIVKYPTLRTVSLSGTLLFGAFSNFWTTMAFMLESPSYNMNSNQIGLFGLFGVGGALVASFIGRLNDKKILKQ